MRFSDFTNIARHHPIRIAAARRIRALHGTAENEFNIRRIARRESQQREDVRKWFCAATVWEKPNAVGCVDTGEMFGSPHEAAMRMGVVHGEMVRRSAQDGRRAIRNKGRLPSVRFVWLNKRRWREKTVWDMAGAVGCVQSGQLFWSATEAARMIDGLTYQDVYYSAQSGVMVFGRRWRFVWLDATRRRAAEEWRRQRGEQTRHTRRKEAKDESRDWKDNRRGRQVESRAA